MSRCASPWISSGGAPHRPKSVNVTNEASVNQPSAIDTFGFSSLVFSRCSADLASCFLQERPEGEHPGAGEQHREHRQQPDPRPGVRRYAVDGGFPGAGGAEEHRRDHRAGRAAAPASRGRGGPPRARRRGYRWPPPPPSRPGSRGRAAARSRARSRRARPRRRRARPRARAAGSRSPTPCRGRSRARRGPRGASRRAPPLSASIAYALETASSAASSTVTQNRPGRDPFEHAAVGVEREREQQQHDEPERQHLLQRDTGARLDPQVLARDEHDLAPEHHRTTCTVWGGTGAAGSVPERGTFTRRGPTGDQDHLALRERACVLHLVRRDQHGAALRRRVADDRVEHRASFGVEARMGLVEQQQSRISRPARRRARGAVAGPPRGDRAPRRGRP